MLLDAGSRVGPYEIIELLGVGGMGEVYRARDTKLGRDVAVKLLRNEFADNRERVARLEREARILASLSQSNVATLFGFEESDGYRYLVMELVPGETLAEKLERGPLSVDGALAIAAQITDALDAAHENGVIHRDLKPANVKVTPEGHVKVLDFGLAKAFAPDEAVEAASSSPTLSAGETRAGVILGTAAYMSPEQARGDNVDKRSDIFSFGSVLFEMLAGRRPFRGDSVSDILATILKTEPDWTELPANVDPRLEELVRACLHKEPKSRRRDIGDVRNTIRGVQSNPIPHRAQSRPVTRWHIFASVTAASLLAGVLAWNLKPQPARPVTKLSIPLPPSHVVNWWWAGLLAISPDGRQLVFEANNRLYRRALGESDVTPIRGAENGRDPAFSPDGRWVAFYADGSLKKISVDGGVAVALCGADWPRGVSWDGDDMIRFGDGARGAFEISPDGGEPRLIVEVDATKEELVHAPSLLPDGDHWLFTVQSGGSWDDAKIVKQSRITGERPVLVDGGTSGRYIPSGHLAYARGGVLFAAPFDPRRLEVTGEAVSLVDGVLQAPSEAAGAVQYAFSESGTLAWIPASASLNRIAWISRNGAVDFLPLRPTNRVAVYPRLSPDEEQVALVDGTDIWAANIRRGSSTRLTFSGYNNKPEWSPDGKRIFFSSGDVGEGGTLVSVSADGGGVPTELSPGNLERHPESISPDGRALAFREREPGFQHNIWIVRLDENGEPRVFARTPFNERGARFSPDGRLLAYVSDESGRDQIYVQPFPGPGGKIAVSTEGGDEPTWSPRGGELFYRNGDQMMSVKVSSERVGTPEILFERPDIRTSRGTGVANYDVAENGSRFLMVVSSETTTELHIVLNWFEELERVVTAAR